MLLTPNFGASSTPLLGGARCRQRVLVCNCSVSSIPAVKNALLKAVSNTNRGKTATPDQKHEILELILSLENQNPTRNPARSGLINGSWALVYQAPINVAPSAATTVEGPFLGAFQPFTRGLLRTRANLQVIDTVSQSVQNIAEFVLLNRWNGQLNIKGTCRVSDVQQGEEASRVDVEFTGFELRVGDWNWFSPLTFVRPKGWVQTTFLDDNLRVGRGDKGSIFVAARTSEQRMSKA